MYEEYKVNRDALYSYSTISVCFYLQSARLRFNLGLIFNLAGIVKV